MILEIMTRDMDAVAYSCIRSGFNYKFTPTEFNGIVKVRISDNGREISPELAYRLCETAKQKMKDDEEAERQELPLSESDLMPNDVVILVDDLPR